MGVMRFLVTGPLARWVLLVCKLVAGTVLAVITCYVFLGICALRIPWYDRSTAEFMWLVPFDINFDASAWLTVLPALIVSGLMLGALWLFLSVHIKQLENFAGALNFVLFPLCFFSSWLFPPLNL